MRSNVFLFFVSIIATVFIVTSSSDEDKRNVDEIKENVLEDEKVLQSSLYDHQTHDNERQQSDVSVEYGDLVFDESEITDFSQQSQSYNHIENGEYSSSYQDVQSESNSLSEDDVVKVKKETVLTELNIELKIPDNTEDVKDVDLSRKDNEEGSNLVSNPPVSENKDMQSNEKDTKGSTKKQRYFPLLYTFGSLFSSFLADFGEVSSSSDTSNAVNSSDSNVKNSSSVDGLLQHLNATSNSTDQGKRTRFQCSLHKNSTAENLNETAKVSIINSTELLEILNFSKNQKTSPCVLVMFYTKWCHFSARAAPEYNALARAFPQLDVLAVDTSHFSYLNAKFGTVAVPNIMLFHSRSAVRFNHTTRDLDNFIQFVSNNTGLEPSPSVAVLPEDFEGPLSSQVVQGRDWLLWLAWAFILVCSMYGFFFSLYGQAVIARLRVLWQEHQHIE